MSKCEACIHKKNCIDGVDYKYADKCSQYVREEARNKNSAESALPQLIDT